ncbi:MAG: sigma-70 family RNA polymerase sigma factor [Verrucomicrobiota bacterium]
MIFDLKDEPGGSEESRSKALAMLCENYWYPVYAYIRKCGRGAEDAQDLTQDFFYKMIHGELFKKADAGKGKLRTFLLTTVARMLVSDWRSRRRQKRGGGAAPLSLDIELAERNYAAEPKDTLTPEKLYDRRWALLTINSVFDQLRGEFNARGKSRHFDLLGECLTPGGSDLPYSEIAAELGLSDAAVRQAVRRLRGRFGELMRERVAFTVEGNAEVEEELRSLMEAFQ